MTKRDKRLQKLRQNMRDVSFEELEQVLLDHGFMLDRVTGSHHIFRAEVGERVWRLAIPYNKPVKIVYVRQSLDAMAEVTVARGQNNED